MPVQISVLSIPATLATGPDTVHPTLLHDDENAVLIDTCLPGAAPVIAQAMEDNGVPLSRLTHIVITHADMDHIGSLAQLLALAPQRIEVLCHERERPYVECEVPPLRLTQMEKGLSTLSGERLKQMTALVENLRANYRNLRAEVTRALAGGEALPCGAEVVGTPGHTPGHICLYLRERRTLIAGDALNVKDGRLMPAPERLTWDREATAAALKKLAGFDVETAVCFHGGVFNENVNQRIKEIAENEVCIM